MLHIVHALFLVGAAYHANTVITQGQTAFFDGIERIEGSDERTLIVHGAASVDAVVVDLAAEGRISPAVTLGNDVQVGKNADLLAAGAVLNIADLIVNVYHRFKAQLFAQIHGILQCLPGFQAVRSTRLRVCIQAGDFDDARQGLHHLAGVFLDAAVQCFYHVFVPSFLLIQIDSK